MFGVLHVVLYSFLTTPCQYNTALSAVCGFESDSLCPWKTSSNTQIWRVCVTASYKTHPVRPTTTRVHAGMRLGIQNTALQRQAPAVENRMGYRRSLRGIPAQALRGFWHMRGRNLHWLMMAKIFCSFCSFLEECKCRCGSLWLTLSSWLSVEGTTSGKTCGTSPQYDGLKLQRINEVYEQLVSICEYRRKRAFAVFRAVCDMKPLSWRQLLLFTKLSGLEGQCAEDGCRTFDQIRRLFIVTNIHGRRWNYGRLLKTRRKRFLIHLRKLTRTKMEMGTAHNSGYSAVFAKYLAVLVRCILLGRLCYCSYGGSLAASMAICACLSGWHSSSLQRQGWNQWMWALDVRKNDLGIQRGNVSKARL